MSSESLTVVMGIASALLRRLIVGPEITSEELLGQPEHCVEAVSADVRAGDPKETTAMSSEDLLRCAERSGGEGFSGEAGTADEEKAIRREEELAVEQEKLDAMLWGTRDFMLRKADDEKLITFDQCEEFLENFRQIRKLILEGNTKEANEQLQSVWDDLGEFDEPPML